ncbi:carbonic anhydrase [Vibrio navarrensis]|uniref:carbonic anhydrase n=1 Tax=Vibrio navarrensis TaxID=29495 RepID=UPI00186AB4C6|nr:carbonic anhydrase [Vibrio navarrensis]MBE4609228.1 carbonic anhydrase [Vibrio navarrensis]MBE4612839.1 carbonic anhydrase [Vibrio navarrensis]
MKKQISALFVTLVLSNTALASEWGYEGHHGPEHWGNVAKECAMGKNQSPINIAQPVEAEMKALELNYAGQAVSVINNGHALQAGVSGNNFLNVDGKSFELKQFHFHTPSENVVKGKQYPLEAHFVHADSEGNLAVVAVMYDTGRQNPLLSELTAKMPTVGEQVTLSHAFDVAALLPKQQDYYRFNGSLTTPPCSEGVRWFVLKQASELSSSQTEQLMSVMGHNNRPLQPLNARTVLSKD